MAIDMKQLARLGAEARVVQINTELAEIRAAFGMSRGRRQASAGESAQTATADDAGEAQKRKRWTMSAAQKRAVGLRMKKYWAARRKAKP